MVKAILDRVFIRIEQPTASKGGIFMPENIDNPPTIGIVEAVGPDVGSVCKGDKVLFHVFDELPSYDKDVVVVRESSLLGVFENE
ncbi:MAG: co-chaperone GroES [Alphaproteobacteria bacterium]|nr:co-chaperone GroES [Alphaproteobacteria bacterium]MBQ7284870.1 co-chaperone GroES [Alphaproteobacteria bacterium]